jgi:two-component system cell cycle response regulator DivK
LLAAHGHEPQAVLDSRMALDAARAFKPDLVITDIQLPHITGLELMALIRKDQDLHDVPIMAVTAYAGVGDDERIRAAGAQAYVSKPISVMRFAETVEELLAGKTQEVLPAGTP